MLHSQGNSQIWEIKKVIIIYGLKINAYLAALIPDLKETVPRSCGHCHSIISNTQAANTVIMARQDTCKNVVIFRTESMCQLCQLEIKDSSDKKCVKTQFG